MAATIPELRSSLKSAMLENVAAQRVIDQARRTPQAAKIGKCIDLEFLRSHLADMGVMGRRDVLDEMFAVLDPDGDGVVDYQAFLKSICGAQARDFIQSMQRLITSDSVRETKLRRVARRRRLAAEAAMEVKDPFELLRRKLAAGDNDGNFRKAFKKFRCRTAQHLSEDSIDYRGFKQALVSMGVELSEAKMRRVFNTIDRDGGRTIDYTEFANALGDGTVTKSGVRDWAQEVAEIRWKQKEAFEAAAAIVRNPSGLYVTLRNMVRVLSAVLCCVLSAVCVFACARACIILTSVVGCRRCAFAT